MRVVAYIELVILVRIILGAVTFQNSLLSPIIYASFLRQRYYQSAFTREAIATTNTYITKYAHKEGTPPMIGQVWDKFQMLLSKWVGGVITQNPAGAAPPRRG